LIRCITSRVGQTEAAFIPASVTTTQPKLTHDPQAKPLARSVPVSIRIPASTFDQATGHYLDNVIVYAHLISS
jgi:hypothetical protein